MDQRERIGDLQEAIRAAIEGYLANLWTATPGIVQSVDFTKMTAVVQPATTVFARNSQGIVSPTTMKVIYDVPIIFPVVGNFAVTLPLQAGDEVLLIFATRCIDAWWQNGGVQNPTSLRLHDLSDGFAIPGPQSLPK